MSFFLSAKKNQKFNEKLVQYNPLKSKSGKINGVKNI